MRINSKALAALLTMAACAPLAFAQDSAQGQTQTLPPAQQGQAQAQRPQGRSPMGAPGGQTARRFSPVGQMNGQGYGGMRGAGNWRGHRHFRRRHHRRSGFGAGRGARGFRGGMSLGRGPAGPMGFQGGAGGGMGPGMRAGGGPGMGRGFGPGMGRGGEMGLARFVNNPSMRQQLGITDEQVSKFHQQNEDFQKAGIQNRATMQIKNLELNDLLRADKPDRAAIDKKLAEVTAAQAASEKARIDHQLAMRSLLTPDQQTKLKQMMQNQPGMGPGRGPGGRGGPNGPGRG